MILVWCSGGSAHDRVGLCERLSRWTEDATTLTLTRIPQYVVLLLTNRVKAFVCCVKRFFCLRHHERGREGRRAVRVPGQFNSNRSRTIRSSTTQRTVELVTNYNHAPNPPRSVHLAGQPAGWVFITSPRGAVPATKQIINKRKHERFQSKQPQPRPVARTRWVCRRWGRRSRTRCSAARVSG